MTEPSFSEFAMPDMVSDPTPRGDLSGFWSRRIDDANRLVYEATDGEIRVIACRYHYGSN